MTGKRARVLQTPRDGIEWSLFSYLLFVTTVGMVWTVAWIVYAIELRSSLGDSAIAAAASLFGVLMVVLGVYGLSAWHDE